DRVVVLQAGQARQLRGLRDTIGAPGRPIVVVHGVALVPSVGRGVRVVAVLARFLAAVPVAGRTLVVAATFVAGIPRTTRSGEAHAAAEQRGTEQQGHPAYVCRTPRARQRHGPYLHRGLHPEPTNSGIVSPLARRGNPNAFAIFVV